MLGRFLEVSLRVESLGDGIEFFRSLGFMELGALDVLSEPYAAVWDGSVAIGLREGHDAPALTFVRPELETYRHAFRHAGVALDLAHLSANEFHRAGFVDPNGQLVMLNEARTYAPSAWRSEAVAACGRFVEYSLAVSSLDGSAEFWRRLGLAPAGGGSRPHRWTRLAGHGLVLGLHETAPFRPGLTFRAVSYEARCGFLEALGRTLSSRAPVAVDTNRSATLSAPGSLAIYLLGEADD